MIKNTFFGQNELTLYIMEFLTPEDILNIARTSSVFAQLSQEHSLWENIYGKGFITSDIFPSKEIAHDKKLLWLALAKRIKELQKLDSKEFNLLVINAVDYVDSIILLKQPTFNSSITEDMLHTTLNENNFNQRHEMINTFPKIIQLAFEFYDIAHALIFQDHTRILLLQHQPFVILALMEKHSDLANDVKNNLDLFKSLVSMDLFTVVLNRHFYIALDFINENANSEYSEIVRLLAKKLEDTISGFENENHPLPENIQEIKEVITMGLSSRLTLTL